LRGLRICHRVVNAIYILAYRAACYSKGSSPYPLNIPSEAVGNKLRVKFLRLLFL